jgi:hypothetical protein
VEKAERFVLWIKRVRQVRIYIDFGGRCQMIYIYIYIAFFEEASYILYMYQPAGKLRSIYF